jgi:hypothetical protein
VVSGLNPQQTFLELLDADAVPQDVCERAGGFEYNLLAPLFSLNLALDEPPRHRAAERPELRERHGDPGPKRFRSFPKSCARTNGARCHRR